MNDKKNSLDETTKVADYFKGHEGIFIATVSATITAITVIISFLAYVYQKIILQEYKVPLDIINTLNHGRLFYYILMSMGIFAVNPLIQSLLLRILLQHYRKMALDKLFRINLCDNEDSIHREAFNCVLDKDKREHIRNLFLSILAVSILFFVAYTIHTIATGSFGLTMIVSCGIICLFNLLLAKGQARKQAGEYGPEKIEKLIEDIKNEPDQEKRANAWRQRFDDLVNDTLDGTFQNKFISDGKVLEYALLITLSVVAVSLFVVISAYAEAKTQNSYWIFQDNIKTYAVVYQNPEVFVLEEAVIRDDEITIVRNHQRYLQFEDVEVKKHQFRRVEKVDEVKPMEILDVDGNVAVC